eukprot:TRINITY_DN321_c2_g1_i1.p1 TRINITY_DN321_c2_g1~~TRINITY_DN321_c2_g1_i1.p1  ORF type:complete len:349 (-),score=154.13 TRINITY_DN321_c2_g1_i1:27-1073(-)
MNKILNKSLKISSIRKFSTFNFNNSLPKKVKIVEVGPRDGLQNEPKFLPTSTKISLIERLVNSGLSAVEATAFVSPKKIPQMADSFEVLSSIKKIENISYPVLAPNMVGLEKAIAAGAKEVSVLAACTNTFSQRNNGWTINEALAKAKEVTQAATKQNIIVRGYISCSLGCPYEGNINPNKPTEIAEELLSYGCYEVAISDTIGVGTPGTTSAVLEPLLKKIDSKFIAVHFHDTFGQALSNILVALQYGICVVDSSIAGLGGCPYAAGASGNVATEDVVYMLQGLGIDTGINLNNLIEVGNFISATLGRNNSSKVAVALTAKRARAEAAASTNLQSTQNCAFSSVVSK